MRKLLLLSLIALRMSATISPNVEWDVRPTGADANGGGFVFGATGTDYSQQNAPQYSAADLASSNGSTNPCAVTSASHSFVATDVGNTMNISAGTNWLTGATIRYSIVSVAGGAATLDRACGSVAALTAGTYAVGGAFATIGQAAAVSQNTTVMGGAGLTGGTINIKSGSSYVLTSTVTININPVALAAYQNVHGDQGTPATVTTATNSTVLFTLANMHYTFDNFIFTNTAATPAVGISTSSGEVLVRNASFSGFTNGLNTSGAWTILIGVEVKNSTGVGVQSGTTNFLCDGCWIHANTGANVNAGGAVIANSLITNGSAQGVVISGSPGFGTCLHSTIANNTGNGWAGTGSINTMEDCIIYGNGAFGVVGPGVNNVSNIMPNNVGRNNAYGSNTSGDLSNYTSAPGAMNGTTKSLNDVALSASPFIGSPNYALNSNAGGGTAARGAGWPGAYPGGSTTGTFDIGGVQTGTSGGSGGGATGGYGGGYTP